MASLDREPSRVGTETDSASPRRLGRGRSWLLRCLAVLIGLCPLVALEGLCVLFDWGRPALHDDPFVGFRSTRPLFVLDAGRTRYEIPKSRQWHFRPASFAAQKGAREFRIFCLGGSTVQGEPFEPVTSFTTWLAISLRAADPTRDWQVINCGGVSYATYRLVPILEEVLGYEPDLIIFCEGHNEFLESRQYERIADRGPLVNEALDKVSRCRTFTLAREGYLRLRGISSSDPPRRRPILPTEVEALLDYRGGLEAYHHDDVWRRGVIAHFRVSLERIVEIARQADVPLILINPVSNLLDTPPFKSEHRPDLSAADEARWESLCEQARRALHGDHPDRRRAIRLFLEACELDPLHAGGFYNLGKCLEAAGEFDQAREALLKAKELDVCPLRILEPMNQAVLDVAAETDTPLVDAQAMCAERSRNGIVGGEWLVDHVHPGVEGHKLLADALADMLVELGVVEPAADWQAVKQARYQSHQASLDPLYFIRAMERLKRLEGWAHGRVARRRLPTSDERPAVEK
jgi:tetratricopeptide (TPR) repeat protein